MIASSTSLSLNQKSKPYSEGKSRNFRDFGFINYVIIHVLKRANYVTPVSLLKTLLCANTITVPPCVL